MFYLDPLYLVFAAPALLLMLYAQFRVNSAFNKYSAVANMQGLTGAQVAKRLLGINGLEHVGIEGTGGNLTDHYDPRSKVLRLSPNVYRAPSVAAMGIVAHEVGHALQDSGGYFPMKVRGALVPAASVGSWMGYIFFLAGIFLQIANLVWLGIIFFTGAVAFALVTLPVEWDASNRAKLMLRNAAMVSTTEYDAVNTVLSAAALTYVAALLQAVASLLYYVTVALGMGRRDD
ncbi:MAG: zinc metallopeptidase [Chloroflexi bacterium]|nr:zinc metallopeptidase [Chloroflexota bacterium]